MLVRYFGAAQAAAGVAEERLDLGSAPLADVLDHITSRYASPVKPGAPSMIQVIGRSSFLLNEVSLRDRSRELGDDDTLDILPPFAGG
ncbi:MULTISPECIES: MoaD/ThiS family protein [unclassified Arthrobacter]|uniref:MoaD/ThiS family protein n=1 Tax=unclassified Arthrobacter TaxID=235627 RepID=UPI00149275F3|nr:MULTISPECIES: MoaD/ThiS family protein [unclassified Arthrobacter]MBE0011716.1 MoaD/ThiS family protein [Arthrobacter sp. AET 35A]NOJ61234.1 MoaD/ThiS family protein [Arthrobacter sp. 260]